MDDPSEKYATTQARFITAVKRLTRRLKSLKMELNLDVLITLVCQLQLALRHPDNTGPSAEAARSFCEWTIRVLEKQEPDLGPLLRLGFDPDADVTLYGG